MRPEMYWLAIELPLLPLESLAPEEGEWPLAVTVWQGPRQCVLQANRLALADGVAPGMTSTAARTLSAGLRLRVRDEAREQAALDGVAIWSGRFTSQVSLDPPWGLLLELGGSLRLFGGIDALLSEIRNGLDGLGYSARTCLAPTPAAAMLLARSGRQEEVHERGVLPAALARVALEWLPVERPRLDALRGAGLETLGDLMELPSPALGRRLGPTFLDYLHRLLGSAPDPRPLFRPPERFCRSLELPAEVHSRPALLFAFRRLLLELEGYLSARQSGTQCLEWLLIDAGGRETRFRLGLLAPTRDPDYLQKMLLERLERVHLSAPVCGVGLMVEQIQALSRRTLALFSDCDAVGKMDHLLLERLQARLGKDAVCAIRLVPDHRPECAWSRCAPSPTPPTQEADFQTKGASSAPRPLWLLPEPELLEVNHGWPWRGGRLQLEPERERVESGWWDGRPVSRDYFLARGTAGERLWIYRELGGERRWFLHGFF